MGSVLNSLVAFTLPVLLPLQSVQNEFLNQPHGTGDPRAETGWES